MNSISPEIFRDALGNFATGVTIVTARGISGAPVGMTANSFASVSLDPPLVLWSVDRSAPEAGDFMASSHYAIHILGRDQQQLSDTFSDFSVDKFAGISIERGIEDLPLLNDYSARLQCMVVNRHEGGDHVILVGRVLDVHVKSAEPLVFFGRGYSGLQV